MILLNISLMLVWEEDDEVEEEEHPPKLILKNFMKHSVYVVQNIAFERDSYMYRVIPNHCYIVLNIG